VVAWFPVGLAPAGALRPADTAARGVSRRSGGRERPGTALERRRIATA
jgi:hypothetical protein